MKFIATLAAIATFANAITLEADASTNVASKVEAAAKVAAKTEATAEAKVDAKAGSGYYGPIVPENYQQAVH